MADPLRPTAPPGIAGSLLLAVAVPALMAYNEPPSSTFLNQAAALALWCAVVAVVARWLPARDLLYRGGLGLLWWALALLMFAAVMSPVWAALPWGLSLSGAGVILAAGVVASAGAAVSQARRTAVVFRALAWALVVAGVASSGVAFIQVYAPGWADGTWIARSTVDGRAVGNLRQSNHLASLLVWAGVAVAWLAESALRRTSMEQAYAPTEMDTRGASTKTAQARRKRFSSHDRHALLVLFLAGLVMVTCMAGMVLSGSRTGWLGALVLAAWGLVDRRLNWGTRGLLIAAPLLAGLALWAMSSLGAANNPGALLAGMGVARTGSDISSSRFAIWSNTLELIADHPWLGVGFGEFNFAWTLTPFAQRPVAFFDHAHNLPLHLAAELGVPMALVVMGLLGWVMWRAFMQVRRHEGEHGSAVRAAFVLVLLMVVHSQLEYPLWYAHFLLPTAFALGLCLAGTERRSMAARAEDPTRQPPVRTMLMAALLGIAGAVLAVWDYQRVAVIFQPDPGSGTLAERIAEGRQSWLFGHHADYAAVTTAQRPSSAMPGFDRAAHHLLDARLLRAWAIALDETNQVDRSRHVAQRLAEFRNPLVADFFAVCANPPGVSSGSSTSLPTSPGVSSGALVASALLTDGDGMAASAAANLTSASSTAAASVALATAQSTARSPAAVAAAASAASWVQMAASFPAPVEARALPKGPPTPQADPAFAASSGPALPFQCLRPNRALSFQDFR